MTTERMVPEGGYQNPLNRVVELVETNWRRANAYLDAGYVLLGIQTHTKGQAPTNPVEQFYVKKFAVYVLGRMAGTPHFELPVAESSPAQAPNEAAS